MIDEIVFSAFVDAFFDTIDIRRFLIFLYNFYIFSLSVNLFLNVIAITMILEVFEECICLNIVVVVNQLSFTSNSFFDLEDQIF